MGVGAGSLPSGGPRCRLVSLKFNLILTLLSTLLFFPTAKCALVNRTIDDASRIGVQYIPASGVWKGVDCSDCVFLPNLDLVHDNTIMRSTFRPNESPDQSMILTFTGTSIWVYAVLIATNRGRGASHTSYDFSMDGGSPTRFLHRAVDGDKIDFIYNALVYSRTGMDNTPHRLVLTPASTSTYFCFDYAIYSQDDGINPTPTPIPPTSTTVETSSVVTSSSSAVVPSSSTSNTSSQLSDPNSTQIPPLSSNDDGQSPDFNRPPDTSSSSERPSVSGAMIGGIVAGVVVLLALVFFILCRRRRRIQVYSPFKLSEPSEHWSTAEPSSPTVTSNGSRDGSRRRLSSKLDEIREIRGAQRSAMVSPGPTSFSIPSSSTSGDTEAPKAVRDRLRAMENEILELRDRQLASTRLTYDPPPQYTGRRSS